MRVLLVEDQPDAARMIAKGLREQAYAVDHLASATPCSRRRSTTTMPSCSTYRCRLLRQMALNLLENAVRHTPAGGTVMVNAMSAAAPEVRLTVEDTGRGIPEADRDRIFDRFVRIDPLTDGMGMGLGLAIARRIARAHGGELILVATGPTGTTFGVSLPITAADGRDA